MAEKIRVGIIGANAKGGWAREGHVPAVQRLAGMELVAVATNSQETADEAAKAFGVKSAYSSGTALIRSPDIDLVTVATRVTDHRALVLAAISAGKHVYSEWPLGCDSAEAVAMAAAAREAHVHVAIGLKLRGSPVVHEARELIASLAIGRILTISAYSATAGFGQEVPAPYAYLEDPSNFANLVTIQGAHTIDLAIALAGRLIDLSALTTAQYPEITVGDSHEKRRRTTFDHLLMRSRMANGATLAIEVAGGRPPMTPFRLEVTGETGTLRLEGGAPLGFQSGRLSLTFNGARRYIDEGELAEMPDAAANVAGVYAALRDAIVGNTPLAANFDHAVQLTQLITDLFNSSVDGTRVLATNWPAQRH